ncbi:MAG: pyridoxamine 5'-phosphate oxidase family protein [Spirochaetes bacterium]|nr:pyridoxamine 5'-phosphate oxidase family protein [Spirochaetota bacterium]
MSDKNTREIISGLLNSQITGVLATNKDDQPYGSLVAFSFSDDFKKIFFATLSNTTKYKNLLENPQVSIVIDSRRNDPGDFSGSIAISALGRSRELTGDLKVKMIQIHSNRLPGLSNFLKMDFIAIFEIEVNKYIVSEGVNTTNVFIP